MGNFYILGLNSEKSRAVSALTTILQDESLQLTVQADRGGNYFFIKDKENSDTYGQTDIDGYHFDNLEQTLDAFEEFHQSCFFNDLDTRCDDNNIEFGDYDAAVGYLLTSNEFREILQSVTPDNWDYPIGVVAEINQTKLIDFAEKLLCKEIVETMSACALVEEQSAIWMSFYGVNDEITHLKKDPVWNFQDWWNDLISTKKNRDFFMRYTSYAELLKTLQYWILEDFDEMGSDFYLNKAALCFMGLNWLIFDTYRTNTDYQNYQLQWMQDHAYSLEDLIVSLEKYRQNTFGLTIPELFQEWEFNQGFNGEIWSCEDEFEDLDLDAEAEAKRKELNEND